MSIIKSVSFFSIILFSSAVIAQKPDVQVLSAQAVEKAKKDFREIYKRAHEESASKQSYELSAADYQRSASNPEIEEQDERTGSWTIIEKYRSQIDRLVAQSKTSSTIIQKQTAVKTPTDDQTNYKEFDNHFDLELYEYNEDGSFKSRISENYTRSGQKVAHNDFNTALKKLPTEDAQHKKIIEKLQKEKLLAHERKRKDLLEQRENDFGYQHFFNNRPQLEQQVSISKSKAAQRNNGPQLDTTGNVVTFFDGESIGNNNLTPDFIYELQGRVYVNAGETLDIAPGTIIKANFGASLIVARDGVINANGTPTNPILFTSSIDTIQTPYESTNLTANLGEFDRGFWGGIIILGNAATTQNGGSGNIGEYIGFGDPRNEFGGIDNLDNSGSLSYVTIRHAGEFQFVRPFAGLVLGGVGSGTNIDHVEIYANGGLGVEYIGGAVNVSHLYISAISDVSMVATEGYTGKNQFVYVENESSQSIAFTSNFDDPGMFPFTNPLFYNLTISGLNSAIATFETNGSGKIKNSIFENFNEGAIITYNDTIESSWNRVVEQEIVFQNNFYTNLPFENYLNVFDESFNQNFDDDPYIYSNLLDNVQFTDTGLDEDGVPQNDVTVFFPDDGDPYLTPTSYAGAFEPGQIPWSDEWTTANAAAAIDVDLDDYAALIALYEATGGDGWFIPWDTAGTSPSQWHGVQVFENRVTGLFLDNNNLSGVIPNEVANLSEVQQINIGSNQIVGLPDSIHLMTNLQFLFAYNNFISELPVKMGEMNDLRILDLNNNAFAVNQSIPNVIFEIDSLRQLAFDNNQASEIPANVSNLTKLNALYLSGNNFTDIGDVLNSNISLTDLFISNCNLSKFPELNNLTNLVQLNLGFNQIFDQIPDNYGSLSSLEGFYAYDNRIFGDIPATFGNLNNLIVLDFTINSLNLPLPGELGEMDNLQSLYLGSNKIPGTIPVGITNSTSLRSIELYQNNLTGPIPAEIGNMTQLEALSLWFNFELGGVLPPEIGQLTNLLLLDVNDCDLTGTVPVEIGDMTNLNSLYLSANNFTGAIPNEMDSLQNLSLLWLFSNELEDLPDLRDLTNLGSFRAWDNRFEFDDFEPLMQHVPFAEIAPQKLPQDEFIAGTIGLSVGLDATVGGSVNNYQWYFNNDFIENADSAVFNINAFSADSAGLYTVEITNDSVTNNTGLVIYKNFVVTYNEPVLESDSSALVDLYVNTNASQNWNYGQNWLNTPVALWEGITIENERVVEINLPNNNMMGGIPTSIGSLTGLQVFNVHGNHLTYIPAEFWSLTNLEYLDLGPNEFSGKISNSIRNLTNLQVLDIGYNYWASELPEGLFEIESLRELYVINTEMIGPLSSDIANLINLERLALAGNGFSGPLPDVFDNFPNLNWYYDFGNNWSGSLPPSFFNLPLTTLVLGYSPLIQGSLPEGLQNFTELFDLRLYGNDLSVSGLPTWVGDFALMKSFNINGVNLGADPVLPAFINNFQELEYLAIGQVDWADYEVDTLSLPSLRTFALFQTNVDTLPVLDTDSLTYLYIYQNELTSLPDVALLGDFELNGLLYAYENNLTFADLLPYENYFINSFNFDISNQALLSQDSTITFQEGEELPLELTIDVGDTTTNNSINWIANGNIIDTADTLFITAGVDFNFDVTIQAEVFNTVISPLTGLQLYSGITLVDYIEPVLPVLESDSTALVALYDAMGGPFWNSNFNWKQGPVSSWHGVGVEGDRVVFLDLSANGLTGDIPDTVGTLLTALRECYLQDNDISGDIPTSLFESGSFERIDIGRNNLTGSVPATIGNNLNLSFLGIAGNKLTGSLPPEIGSILALVEFYSDQNYLSGPIPASYASHQWAGFSVDRNYFTAIPEGMDTTIQFAFYSNFDYNEFNFDELAKIEGIGADQTFQSQNPIYNLELTGQPDLGNDITLEVTNPASQQDFVWYRVFSDGTVDEIAFTGNDPTLTFTVSEIDLGTRYLARGYSPLFRSFGYPINSNYVLIDGLQGKFASSATASVEFNYAPAAGIVGPPDDVDGAFDGKNYYRAPEFGDRLTVTFDDPSPISYLRLFNAKNTFGPGTAGLLDVVFYGTGDEKDSIRVNRIMSANVIYQFELTEFPVASMDLYVAFEMDAIELGVAPPVTLPDANIDDQFSYSRTRAYFTEDINAPFGYIGFDIAGGSNVNFLNGAEIGFRTVIERSQTLDNTFEVIDTLNRIGGFYTDFSVPAIDTFYYRTKVIDIANESAYSNVLKLGNCETQIPGLAINDKDVSSYWNATTEANGEFSEFDTSADSIIIFNAHWGENNFIIQNGNFHARWFDQFTDLPDPGETRFFDNCGDLQLNSSSGGFVADSLSGRFENDTLYIYWENDLNGITGTTKFVYVGPVDNESEQVVFKPRNPAELEAGVLSSDLVILVWDADVQDLDTDDQNGNASLGFGPVEDYVIYRSEGDDQNYIEIGTIESDTTEFFDINLKNGIDYFYRITARNISGESFPSNESIVRHRIPYYDPQLNTITLDAPKTTYGASWADFDRDGDLDVYVANAFEFGNNYLYENQGASGFKKIVSTVATKDITTTRTSAWGDMDNDGFLDLYVPNGSLVNQESFDIVYRNTGSKSFTKVTDVVSSTRADFTPNEGAVWVDVDNDGYLDLVKTTGFVLINDQNGGFIISDTLATNDAPLNVLNSYNWTIRSLDYDQDKDQDIYITGQLYNMLFQNDGLGNFNFIENEISGGDLASRGAAWADYDNDGDLDVLTGEWLFNYIPESEVFDYYQLGIYENEGGSFTFHTLTELIGFDPQFEEQVGRGYTWLDFDNDGYEDIIWNVAGGQNLMLRNQGNKTFKLFFQGEQLFPETSPFSHVSVADMNNDGHTDIFFANHLPDEPNYIYYNNSIDGNNWVKVRLQGTQSNSYAIGAGVKVTAGGNTQYKDVTTQNGLGSGNSLELIFGIGSSGIIDQLQVFWPAGDTTTLENVNANQILTIAERPDVDPDDEAALIALYNATGGENWNFNDGWLVDGVSPRTWTGTFFNAEGRLTSLVLNDNNLVGAIPTEITQLDALEILDLSGNALTGRIPESLGNMTTLTSLSLNDNQLSGSIPESIGLLTNLINLDLFNNSLIGELPETLSGLTSLKQFEVQNNQFIGLFPTDLIALDELEVLNLSQNIFEGELPVGIGTMTQLKVLNIYDNQFFGKLPTEFSGLVELLEFDISGNDFEGQLPASFAALEALVRLDLSDNRLSGSFEPFVDLDSVRSISIRNNRFEVLPEINAEVLESMDIRNNSFDFGDFELNNLLIQDEVLSFNPQDSLFSRVDSLHGVGEPLTISFTIGGSFNNYTWLLNGTELQSDGNVTVNANTISIENPDTPNEGEYVLVITSDLYPELTLVTNPWNLKITSLERDRQALLEFIAAVNVGEFLYQLDGWDEATDDLNDWTGIVVVDERVTELKLPAIIDSDKSDGDDSQILDGRIPQSFADLTGLIEVDLSGNYLRSLPDISQWPNLTSGIFIQNRLSFKDIVPNLVLGSVFSYDPQRRFGVTVDTVAEAGDDYIASVDIKYPGVQYQWKFGPFIPGEPFNNDVSNIENANSRVYLVEGLNFDKMGTYRVEMTHPQTGSFKIEARNINIRAKTQIFGTVFADDQGTLLTDGDILLWRQPIDGPFLKEDSVDLYSSGDSIGMYSFKDMVLGNFILQARPNREVFPNTIQTYYEKADLYDSATILIVRDRLEGIDIEMVFYTEPDPEPTGADFQGEVFTDFPDEENVDEEGNRISGRRKAKRAACSMRKFVRKGRTEQEEGDYELYAYVESDDEGRFNFNDIEEGSYRLNIQYPGVPMDPDSEIDFEVGGDKENQLFTISATITEDGIVVQSEEVLFSMKPYIKDLKLYPNPTVGLLKGEFLVYRKLNDLKVEIHDVKGVKIMEQELSHRMGPQTLDVDFTNFKSGVYFMIFTDQSGTFRQQYKVGKK